MGKPWFMRPSKSKERLKEALYGKDDYYEPDAWEFGKDQHYEDDYDYDSMFEWDNFGDW